MRKSSYFNLLYLCFTLSQGLGTSSEVNINDSSNLQLRKKRIIDVTEHGTKFVTLEQVPYIISILKDGVLYCGGSILAPRIILSAAHCFLERDAKYLILSGSRNLRHGVPHKITREIIHPHFQRNLLPNDLIILLISPPIDFSHSSNRNIILYKGVLSPNTMATFSGWGCGRITRDAYEYCENLRSTTLPIISNEECQNNYRGARLRITNEDICTFDRAKKKCASFGDSGGPLVVNGKLVGVYAWSKSNATPEYPDVFTNLNDYVHRGWINSILHEFRSI